MRSTESQELFMIYLESHQQLSSGNNIKITIISLSKLTKPILYKLDNDEFV